MEKEKLEEIIKNKGIVWVVTNELKKLDFKKINKRDIHLDDEQLEIDIYYGEILRDIYQFEEVFKTKAEAEHYLHHANVTRTETLPFLTWEEFLKEYSFDSCSENYEWFTMYWNDVDGIVIESIVGFYKKTWDLTEENFYKAYDECVRLFRGEK